MIRPARLGLVLAVVVAIGAGAATTAASDHRPKVLDANLAGLPASLTGQTLFGVRAGGLPWRLDGGRVELFRNGRLEVHVRGLVLATGAAEGTNPIAAAKAIVTCQGAPVAASSVVPYSARGNASIEERIDLPDGCLAPAVFFAGVPNPATPDVAVWFAVTGVEG
jgi:hypothetical protein